MARLPLMAANAGASGCAEPKLSVSRAIFLR